VRLERLARVFPYPITTESLAKQIAKISRSTSINDRAHMVSINQLLVNYLLQSGANFINCDRPQSMGIYQSVYDRHNLAATQPSHYTGVCYTN
jgi:hypothetical protein